MPESTFGHEFYLAEAAFTGVKVTNRNRRNNAAAGPDADVDGRLPWAHWELHIKSQKLPQTREEGGWFTLLSSELPKRNSEHTLPTLEFKG